MSHLSEDEVERFLASRLVPAAQKTVVRHLRAGCGVCSRRLVGQAPDRLLQEVADGRPRRVGPDSIRDHTLAASLKQEARWRTDEKKLARSLELLRESPQGYDGFTLRQVRALHGPSLIEALLQRSFELRFRDPRAMRWLAFNAVKAAESLRPEEHDPLLATDVQARAWAGLANSFRINDEFAEAEGALDRARALLRRGSGDLWLLAMVGNLEISLRSDQRRIAEALELVEGVHRLYLKLGDRHLAGRALISKGMSTSHDGRPRRAVQVLRKGLSLLDPDRDPQLVQIGQQGLIHALTESGEYRQAGELLLKSGLRQSFAGDPIAVLRIRWLEGRIQGGLGKTSRAESALLGVRDEFLDMHQVYTAAMVSLNLLSVLRRQGKSREVRETAREVYGTLRDLGIHREAARAGRYL